MWPPPTANLERRPRHSNSQSSSPIKLLILVILQKSVCLNFCVVLLIDTRRCCCSSFFWVLGGHADSRPTLLVPMSGALGGYSTTRYCLHFFLPPPTPPPPPPPGTARETRGAPPFFCRPRPGCSWRACPRRPEALSLSPARDFRRRCACAP